jgi:hypothetical protein
MPQTNMTPTKSLKTLGAALVLSLAAVSSTNAQSAPAPGAQPQQTRIAMQPGFCFSDGRQFIYEAQPVSSISQCMERCEKDDRCQAMEVWEHTKACRLYSQLPSGVPRPQSFFPKNRMPTGEQAQAAIGIKMRRQFF